MKVIERKEVKIGLGILGLGISIFSLFKAFQYFHSKRQKQTDKTPHSPDNSSTKDNILQQELDFSVCQTFDQLIQDSLQGRIGKGRIKNLTNVKDINYSIILSILKGMAYQGVVNITFHLQSLSADQDFCLNFNGSGIKFLKVNGANLKQNQIQFKFHQILIPQAYLRQHSSNSIQVIFQNNYSFLDAGFSSYMIIDEHMKYSLRQQVIYTRSGWNQIQKIIPCLNCTNQCMIHIEVLHPETFNVFSNTPRSIQRVCSIEEYPKYQFLFDQLKQSSGKSLKANILHLHESNASNVSDTLSNYSSMKSTFGSRKSNTHFGKTKLSSIHQMFLFCSTVAQVHPFSTKKCIEEQLLLGYYCKQHHYHTISKVISDVHRYLIECLERLQKKLKSFLNKLDVFIIAGKELSGYACPGVLFLDEDSVINFSKDIDCSYKIARALIILYRFSKNKSVLTLREILQVNKEVLNYFPEFKNYVYLRNRINLNVSTLIGNEQLTQYLSQNESHFIQLYGKQLQYMIRNNNVNQISFELNMIISSINKASPDQFWENLLTNYNFLPPLIMDTIIELGLLELGVTQNQMLREQLQKLCENSKHIIKFYKNNQIQENLNIFLQNQVPSLQYKLPELKIKKKFKSYLTEKYNNYLPVKSNIEECQALYNQFKKFKQNKNFHHIDLLQDQLKRIASFRMNFIKSEMVPLELSLPAWKLLGNLRIYPSSIQQRNLLNHFGLIHGL